MTPAGNRFSHTDFPGARGSKNSQGKDAPLAPLLGQRMGPLQMLPAGEGTQLRLVAPREPRIRWGVTASRSYCGSRPTVSASRTPPPGKRVPTPRDREDSAPPPRQCASTSQTSPCLPASPRTPIPLSHTFPSSLAKMPTPVPLPRGSRSAPLLIPKVSQRRVTALRALARVHRAAPSPQPFACEAVAPEPRGARAREAHASPQLPAPPAQSASGADEAASVDSAAPSPPRQALLGPRRLLSPQGRARFAAFRSVRRFPEDVRGRLGPEEWWPRTTPAPHQPPAAAWERRRAPSLAPGNGRGLHTRPHPLGASLPGNLTRGV